MQLTRDVVFDWIEMVGYAVAGAKVRKTQLQRMLEDLFRGEPDEDEWGLFTDSPWVDRHRTRAVREARTDARDHAFYLSQQLCDLSYHLRKRDIGVHAAFEELRSICRAGRGTISKAWENQITRLQDSTGR